MEICYRFKRLLGLNSKKYSYTLLDIDYNDGDTQILFKVGEVKYLLDLEWSNGVMSVDYSELGDDTYNTTNNFHQYELLRKIHNITYEMSNKIRDKIGIKFSILSFECSDIRNSVSDPKSKEIRDKFFLRYITKVFPNSKVIEKEGKIIVKLNK